MAQTFDEQLRHALETVADRVRRDLDEECGRVAAELSAVVAVEREESETRMTLAARQARQAAEAPFLKLADAIRALDAAATLSEALDALAEGVRDQTGRFALFLVRTDTLRAWTSHGFDVPPNGHGPAGSGWEMPLDSAGLIPDVVRSGNMTRVEPGEETGRPPFANRADRALVLVPVAMKDGVAALVCAEERLHEHPVQPGEPPTSIVLEVLARHAGRVLETMTARRLAQLERPAPGGAAHAAAQVQERS